MDLLYDIELDFSRNDYKILKAKQGDSHSRFIQITCTDKGTPVVLNSSTHSAYVRFKKPDGFSVLNKCQITSNGKIIFELTKQMLVASGVAKVDVVVYGVVDPQFDGIWDLVDDSTTILSTMGFSIEIVAQPISNTDIESADEFTIDDDVELLLSTLTEARGSINQLLQTQEDINNKIEQLENATFVVNFEDGHLYYETPEGGD